MPSTFLPFFARPVTGSAWSTRAEKSESLSPGRMFGILGAASLFLESVLMSCVDVTILRWPAFRLLLVSSPLSRPVGPWPVLRKFMSRVNAFGVSLSLRVLGKPLLLGVDDFLGPNAAVPTGSGFAKVFGGRPALLWS